MLCSHFMHKMARGMTKIHPNANNTATTTATIGAADYTNVKHPSEATESVLTVWKKSLLFNCNGYTVFDSKGNLVFRVDNYMAPHSHEMVLMDAYGSPLFTIRRKRLSLGDSWLVYEGETSSNPRYSVRKHINFLKPKSLVHVNKSGSGGGLCYEIEGSYAQRCCTVLDDKRRKVAEIKQKEAAVGGAAFGTDIFRLIVQPDIDTALAMALVILLDQMFGSSKRYSP